MAIAKPQKKVPATEINQDFVRKEVEKNYEPITVDTAYTPRKSLLLYVEGAKWPVIYYKQLKTKSSISEPFYFNRPSPYQQYLKINNFELRVSDALSNSYDDTSSTQTVTGTASIYPSIIPDHGDHFIADIGDGRSGFFQVKEVQQRSYLKDTTYEITYELVDYVTKELLDKLEACVVKVEYYERSYTDFGANPRLNQEQYEIFKRITEWNESIARHYFYTFFNSEYNTFTIPNQDFPTYDPFLVEFITNIWSVDDVPELLNLRVYNRDTSFNQHLVTIWDAILKADKYIMYNAKKLFGIIPRRMFQEGVPELVGINYSRLRAIYHPIQVKDENNKMIEVLNVGNINLAESYEEYSVKRKLTLEMTKLPGLGFVCNPENQTPRPDAKKSNTYFTYVLSEAFYDQDYKNMSTIEHMTWASIKRESIDASKLITILEDVVNWGSMEQFYYIPLLVAISKIALGDLSQ